MLHHLVLFRFKESLEATERDDVLGQAARLGDIPSVRRLSVKSLLNPSDPAYRSHIWNEFEHALIIEFDDEAGLYAYQKDESHVRFAREIRERTERIRVVDFV